MIKVKSFSDLTAKEKASIRELIDDCIRYEQLELAVPDMDEEEATAYLYYLSAKNPKLISVLFCYDLEEYLEVSAFTSPSHRCQGAFTSLFQKLIEGYEEIPICFYPDGNSYDALMTMEVLECEYSGTEHLMRLDRRPKESRAEQNQTEQNQSEQNRYGVKKESVSLHQANEEELLSLSSIHSAAFDMEEEESKAFLEQAFDSGETIWCITADDTGKHSEAVNSVNQTTQPKELVGLVLTSIQPDQTNLYGLAIHPRHQGKGYGCAAVQTLLQMPKITFPVTLHVTEENEAAYRIYKKLGFRTTQELMEYWY